MSTPSKLLTPPAGTAASAGLTSKRWFKPVVFAVFAVVLLVLPLMLPEFTNQTLARVGVYAVAVLGLNVVMGYTGQVSLGQIFFLGLGAYVAAYGHSEGWPVVVTFLATMIIPGIVGLLISLAAARLGGLAIAMVTIALPIIGVPLAKRLSEFTGGSQGISASMGRLPEWLDGILFKDQYQLYVVIIIAAFAFVLTANLVRGKYGRAFAVVKGNESVASSMGISPYGYKVLAFTVASIIGGLSGFLYMFVVEYTSPETLAFHHSITLLAAMIIGGAGSIIGSLIGGAYYVFVPQITNEINPNMTALLQGIILLAVLFVLPGGIASLPRVVKRLLQKRGSGDRPSGGDLGTSVLGVVGAKAVADELDETEPTDEAAGPVSSTTNPTPDDDGAASTRTDDETPSER